MLGDVAQTIAVGTDTRRSPPLVEQANVELSARLFKGIYTYIAFLAILGISTASFREHPHLLWSTAAITCGALLFQASLILGPQALRRSNPARWRLLIGFSVFFIASAH